MASLLSIVATALPAAAQIVASSNVHDPAAAPWHVDVTSGDRALRSTDWGQSMAVDDVGGRVLFARGYELLPWNYGGGRLDGATTDFRVREISTSTLSAGAAPVASLTGFIWGLSFDSASGLFHVAVEVGTAPYRIDIHAVELNGGGAPSFVRRLMSRQGANAGVPGGVAYAMGPYGIWIRRHDLTAGAEDEQASRSMGRWPRRLRVGVRAWSRTTDGVAVFCDPSTRASAAPGARLVFRARALARASSGGTCACTGAYAYSRTSRSPDVRRRRFRPTTAV